MVNDGSNPHSPRTEFLAGVKAVLPIALGVAPFGLIFGVLAIDSGLPPLLAWSTSFLIFAGSAQFLSMPMFAAGEPAIVLIMTAFIINLRHLLYSASMSSHAQHLPLKWKLILSYFLTDEAYAPTILHYKTDPTPVTNKHWYWLGTGLAMWVQWQFFTAIGVFFGAQLPEVPGLWFTLALTFVGMIVPSLVSRPAVGSALAGGITAVITFSLPYKLNLIIAAIVGISVGLLLESLEKANE